MPRIDAAQWKQRTAWMVVFTGSCLPRRVELHELLVAAQRREPPDQDGRHDDGEDLADERLLLRMEDETTPRLLRDRARSGG